jgi:hypothetical protein
MNSKIYKIRNVVFIILIAIFLVLAFIVFTGFGRHWGPKLPPVTILYLGGVFLIMAAAEVVLSIKIKETRLRKMVFIITGASALAIPVCAVLHNVVYGLFFHGEGGDEAVFFILALFVFPALFIIGTIGSVIILVRERLRKGKS